MKIVYRFYSPMHNCVRWWHWFLWLWDADEKGFGWRVFGHQGFVIFNRNEEKP